MHPSDDPDSITSTNTYSHDNNGTTTNRLEKILQSISIETIEAEAIMYLAIYYHENDDFDSAAMYVYHKVNRSSYYFATASHLFYCLSLPLFFEKILLAFVRLSWSRTRTSQRDVT